MKTLVKILIVAVLAAAVAGVMVFKNTQRSQPAAPAPAVVSTSPAPSAAAASLPRLLDLGADKCIPCKMMAPILEELKKEYAGKLQIDFIDVWKFPDAKEPYNIKIIPTQIFFDASGKELFRHEGFFSKEDILAKWKEFGYNLTP